MPRLLRNSIIIGGDEIYSTAVLSQVVTKRELARHLRRTTLPSVSSKPNRLLRID